MAPTHPIDMERLKQITRASDEIDRCVRQRGSSNSETRFGCTLGEVDWLWELHRLLYEVI